MVIFIRRLRFIQNSSSNYHSMRYTQIMNITFSAEKPPTLSVRKKLFQRKDSNQMWSKLLGLAWCRQVSFTLSNIELINILAYWQSEGIHKWQCHNSHVQIMIGTCLPLGGRRVSCPHKKETINALIWLVKQVLLS